MPHIICHPAVIQIQHRHQKLPRDWKRFLAAAANRIALVDFLFKEWQLPEYARLLNGKCVFVCQGSNCSRFTTNDAVTITEHLIPALLCSAEETDTRMFLHANHAAKTGASCIVIRSPDSDVLVIGCSVAHQILAEIIWQTDTKSKALHQHDSHCLLTRRRCV